MKNLILGGLILSFFGLSLISCEKKLNDKNYESNPQEILKSNDFSNPYDYVGQQHNEVLAYYDLNGAGFQNRSEFYAGGAGFMNQKYGTTINLSTDSLNYHLQQIQARSLNEQLTLFLNNGTINEKQFNYINSIGSIIVDDKSLDEILSELITLEELVNNDKTLSSEQKKYVYISTSVAKYSITHWTMSSESFLKSSKSKCKKYACIALCDVVGVLAGIPLATVSGGASLIVFGALASSIGKCCICCPGSCPNTNGLC